MNYYYENGNLLKIEESETTCYFENGKPTDINPANIEVKNEGEQLPRMTLWEFEKWIDIIHPTKAQERNNLKVIENISVKLRELQPKGELLKLDDGLCKILDDLKIKKNRLPIEYYKSLISSIKQVKKHISVQMQIFENENTVCPPGLNDNSTDEEFNIDAILKSMFKSIDPIELKKLKNNLSGEDKYLSLIYIGRKGKMENELKELKKAGIAKGDIKRVFSKYVRWQKDNCSLPKNLESGNLDKHI